MRLFKLFNIDIRPPYALDNTYGNVGRWGLIIATLETVAMLGIVNFRLPNPAMMMLLLGLTYVFGVMRNPRYNPLNIWFIVYLAINVNVTNPPSVFQSWARLALFISLIMCVGPVVKCVQMYVLRFNILRWILIFACLLSSASLVCFFMGVNFTNNLYTTNVMVVGAFGGLFSHSMILGPVSAMASCYCFWAYLTTKQKLWFVLMVCCLGSAMFSASRSAVYGAALGCLSQIVLGHRLKVRRFRFLLILGMLACISFPLWQGALDGINYKNEVGKSMGEYGSRTDKFEARFDEIEKSPIFGVGFASIDPNGKDVYDTRTGIVEPGSSWLAVTSMTGLIGLAFVLAMYWKAYRTARVSNSEYGTLLVGLLAYCAFHEIFEGYLLAAGSPLCFIAWLIVGVASDLSYAPIQESERNNI